ncbi:MAG TPA: DegT/DnrJ/EryC1/StrS family aminotransferase [Capillimicrobium sp.]|jgi:dTDP-4-amino-4,6-dideoxygalactose transaminase
MSWEIPLTDVEVTEADVAAVVDCLEQGWLTMGPRTSAFEVAVGQFCGSPHAAAVNSGTAALHLASRALDLGPGDEVIVPALTFVATANAVRYTGATPVLCDIASETDLNLDVATVEAKITPRTRAVFAVHFCGYPAEVLALRELCDAHGLRLVEDAAQAIGAVVAPDGRQAGTVGDIGCLSFFSKKQLCVGEGGMVLTADPAVDERVRLLRSHAMTSNTWDRHRGYGYSYDIVDVGYNYRLDEPRAALGLARLPRLREDIEARRRAVRRYRELLADVPGVEPAWSDEQVQRASHFAFPILLPDDAACEAVRRGLAESGIQTTRYPVLHGFTSYADAAPMGSLPRAEAAAGRHCALPLSAATTDEQVARVVERVGSVMAGLPARP